VHESLEVVDCWGSAFGLPSEGALDGALLLLQRAVVQDSGTVVSGLKSLPELWDALTHRLESLSVSNTVSVTGCVLSVCV
jgi:hypothetical protein